MYYLTDWHSDSREDYSDDDDDNSYISVIHDVHLWYVTHDDVLNCEGSLLHSTIICDDAVMNNNNKESKGDNSLSCSGPSYEGESIIRE